MPQHRPDPALAGIFHALADPTRLAIVERLSISPASATDLAKPFAMALPSFMQHMGVLERHAIVTSHKHGRARTYQLAPGALQLASAWSAGGGELIHWSVDEYLPVIAARESPVSRGEARTDAIDSIEFAGPDTVLARVGCSIGPKRFVDLLSLLRIDGPWRVITKVFASEDRDDAPARRTTGSLPCRT